ncbi:MAG: alcohol dehydrogenase catalytic domain-containing protein [Phaeodactylibacter sp.]|nr:alcohol dehydrogenase catalytic domain-containing protein [Phaeodactylibacter sp.]
MKAAIIHHPGEAENLKLVNVPTPEPKEGQVLVKVRAFGLNRSELTASKGLSPSVRFPRILGIECVGEVELVLSGTLKKANK